MREANSNKKKWDNMMEKEIKENNFKVKIISFSVDSFDLIINE